METPEQNLVEVPLTEADQKLLDLMEDLSRQAYLQGHHNKSEEIILIVWNVLGEKYKFVADSARPHPEGKKRTLAIPL